MNDGRGCGKDGAGRRGLRFFFFFLCPVLFRFFSVSKLYRMDPEEEEEEEEGESLMVAVVIFTRKSESSA